MSKSPRKHRSAGKHGPGHPPIDPASTPVLPEVPAAPVFESSFDHLHAELERIDLLLRVHTVRARLVAGDDALRGLSISDGEIEALFARPLGAPHWSAAPPDDLLDGLEAQAREAAALLGSRAEATSGVFLRLRHLQRTFGLSRFELDALLIALAPEVDVRYHRLFGYLNDDVTRRHPTVDLALCLSGATFEDRLAARARFAPHAPLRRHRLVQLLSDGPPSSTLLASGYRADEGIVGWLLGSDELDGRLRGHAEVFDVSGTPHEALPWGLEAQLPEPARERRTHLLHLHGPPGSGRSTLARALAARIGRPLLAFSGASLDGVPEQAAEELWRLAMREAALRDAVLLWREFPSPSEKDARAPRPALWRALLEHRDLVVLAGEEAWEPPGGLPPEAFVRYELPIPPPAERARQWAAALASDVPEEAILGASRHRLTRGQIRLAAATARRLAAARGPGAPRVTPADVAEACRLHRPKQLSNLAHRLPATSGWGDLVLPPDQVERLREICQQARHRDRVFGDWGFERKLSTGRGLSLLFTGPPGTGKTLTASVMARELGLELFQIDLSQLVSKFIGETEKHLATVFAEAEDSGAVLFFDEADALFGKRSEVRDSHDRYANLETSYLLQRIDSYEGMVILASNFSRNLDDAFVRRLNFIVEYSLPDERQRLRLWEQAWPAQTPRSPHLDLPAMARHFELSGGHIRNIVVAAAFLAAAEDAPVSQAHLLHATRRELEKLGRRIDQALFAAARRAVS